MYQIVVQRVISGFSIPAIFQLKRWAKKILQEKLPNSDVELVLRIVDKQEITTLNSTYRKKNKPTNVLSFPFDAMPFEVTEIKMLGDIVICAEVILEEANEQNKTIESHWAHMITHGILHLLGYDHENDKDAEMMEAEEVVILKKLGFDNPYAMEKGEINE